MKNIILKKVELQTKIYILWQNFFNIKLYIYISLLIHFNSFPDPMSNYKNIIKLIDCVNKFNCHGDK